MPQVVTWLLNITVDHVCASRLRPPWNISMIVTVTRLDLDVSYRVCDYRIYCDSFSFHCDLLSVWLEIIVIHDYLGVNYQAYECWNFCESHSFRRDLSSVWLLKLLWITIILLWSIERVTVEIIVNHEHLCVTYRACYYWNYCESQTFLRALSSVSLLKFLWITNCCALLIELVTIEIMVNHEH